MGHTLRLYRNSVLVGMVVFYAFPVCSPMDYLCEPSAAITHDEAVAISQWLGLYCAQPMGRIGDLAWRNA